ncbi:MAG: HD domain-containing protein [Sneathiellaceae bacterium]
MSFAVPDLTGALLFAAEAHANQRRKGAAQEPYVNHLLEVMHLVARASGGADLDLLVAALLHDVVEDTPVTDAELRTRFGDRVADIVAETSDDMSLPKPERRAQRIAGIAHKSPEARLIKIADAMSNLRAVAQSPPAGWGLGRRRDYLDGCRQLVDAMRGTNAWLEARFDRTAAMTEEVVGLALPEAGPSDRPGPNHPAIRELEASIGQPVHIVYLANTAGRDLAEADIDLFCETAAARFPSVTVQQALAVVEGRRRPIILARIRSDSTDAVVAFAQQLCLTFGQDFVGLEVNGRYVRIYADDTG